MATAHPILVMGICGTGKSSVARGVADRMDGSFVEADQYHDATSIARMRAGQPLTDDMRWGWLDRLAAALRSSPRRAILACSALGVAHRDRLRAGAGPLDIVFLHGDRDLIEARMKARRDHYMPTSLIDSQLAALQPPDPQAEGALWIDVALPLARIIDIAAGAFAPPRPTSTGGEQQ
ncbi:gluconokinase [Paracoccus beibuensis]|uniref:gluconokinase n=1 Tax=Paracoccus beibuensis TaxID=547602 RepID=UPI002240C289|nr:gluconokinase, GntK/IdnK-type [Paracoccus beibuensis]